MGNMRRENSFTALSLHWNGTTPNSQQQAFAVRNRNINYKTEIAIFISTENFNRNAKVYQQNVNYQQRSELRPKMEQQKKIDLSRSKQKLEQLWNCKSYCPSLSKTRKQA